MKLLDYTLISLMAGVASPMVMAQASDSALHGTTAQGGPAQLGQGDGASIAIDCTEQTCTGEEGLLFRLRTRSYDRPVTQGLDEGASSQALQPDRRVTVAVEPPGTAVAVGKWSIQLPNGGVIWATEDPNLGQPEFNLSAPSLVPFDSGVITKPVRFYAYNNYSAFIERVEVLLFRATDVDLVSPVGRVELPVAAVSEVEWDGRLPENLQARVGDELVYIARIYGEDGSVDETFPRRLQLVRPEEEERSRQLLRNATERQFGTAMDADEAERASQIDTVFGENSLRQQNIAIYGSRIRIQGRNIPEAMSVQINGRSHPVDLERKLVAEYLVPVGQHQFNVLLKGRDGEIAHTLDIDVTGKYAFAVALADLTLSSNSVTGSIEPLAGDDRYDDSFLAEGRLAFYLKGKIKGKYLITAQADTQEREVKDLFSGFWDADPQDIFRRLDPDAYYPVYGDDSTTYRDVDTMGRLYVRVDWDKSQALWGNFDTGITGTEYGQYSRSLYGGAVNWRSRRSTKYGEAGSQVRAFVSEAQSAPGHSEFIGTFGSQYYLRHTDVLPGSDKVVVEVRDNTTGRVEHRIELLRGADYEIDEFQGRILLTRPLAQVTRENIPTLTTNSPLEGFTQVLLVDYEYIPSGFDPDDISAGIRGKHWFGDHVAVGGTWIQENRAGDDYSLKSADVTLQAGRGTYLKVEHTETEATSAPIFFSDNGGLSFTEINSGLGARDGGATAVEARANFRELGLTEQDWSAGAWWRNVDSGFSIARMDTGEDIEEYGTEMRAQLSPEVSVYGRLSRAERGAESLSQAQLTGEWRFAENSALSGEIRRIDEKRASGDAAGTLAAVQYTQRIGSNLDVWVAGQVTVDDDGGAYEDNDAVRVGAKYLFGELSTVGAEYTAGDRGNALRVDGEYRLSPDHSFYGAYTYSTDRSEYDPLFNNSVTPGWTLGQRWRLSNQVNLFNESQYLKAPNESGLAHTFGMDFYPGQGWNYGFTVQNGELNRHLDGALVKRRTASVTGGRTSEATQWQSKLEWRKDSGAERREQWVLTNRLTHKVTESLRLAGRLNYSETDDDLNPEAGAKFIEGNFGFAFRPWNSTRYALLGKLTYLYDVSSLGQTGTNVAYYDQRSQIASLEGVWMPESRWELATKLMHRRGEVRMGRMNGEWADSTANFAALQARWEFADQWHSLAEYRWLGVKDGGDRQGFLVGIDRDIGRNFRVGIGYNFTEFSDDLTNFDYNHKGWFLNLVGTY
ncbi:hypothetical protein AAV94_00025 [Lampropedia cohaerens]|uniref:Flagellar motor protein MotB n=2 Tax=Lampropedia cohaerens TaxID=1610491 RepID=A0A0U1Q3P6_9BURK|nr:hypothetical protein AAV94_00025 [Lampropedia cohaerens]